MKQGSVGKYAVELVVGQVERKEILLPNFKSLFASNLSKTHRSFQPYSDVAKRSEGFQIATRSAAKVKNRERWQTLDVFKQRIYVLANIVVSRSLPKVIGALVIMRQRPICDIV